MKQQQSVTPSQIAARKNDVAIGKMIRALNSPHEEHFDRARYNADKVLEEINAEKSVGRETSAPPYRPHPKRRERK